MSKLKILVVLYNKELFNSETCLSLIGLRESLKSCIEELFIWNNSSVLLSAVNKQSFETKMNNVKILYLEDGVNHPLSEIYNVIISKIDSNGLLILFDHDSKFSDDYLIRLLESEKENPSINLFLPKIYYSKLLVSPARQIYFYGKYIKDIQSGVISSRFLTAINSGMAIRCRYLKEDFPLYDEDIKFYGTDNDFMWKYSQQNRYAYVLNVALFHTLNYYEEGDLESKLRRFSDMKNGMRVRMKKINNFVYGLSLIYWFLYSCKMSLKYKSLLFLK